MRMARIHSMLAVASILTVLVSFCQAGFYQEFSIAYGYDNIKPNDTDGSVAIALSSDGMGSTFSTDATYLFGSFSVQARLVQGDSAGTVSAYFMISEGDNHDEIDFEFLGNQTDEPYIMHTNVFANGQGSREQQFNLWFDPTEDFHTYQIIWNHELIMWLVDDIPVRLYRNLENVAFNMTNTFPLTRPMVVSACIFDASEWATQGGAIPINYTYAPFKVNFQKFSFEGCQADGNLIGPCATNYASNWWESPQYKTFGVNWANQMAWFRQHYMHYDYCLDTKRYTTPPTECSYNTPSA